MAREEEKRRREAEAAKARLESEQKKQGNEITQMFDRLKSENEQVRRWMRGSINQLDQLHSTVSVYNKDSRVLKEGWPNPGIFVHALTGHHQEIEI